jgi:hypothetical protein
VGYKQEESDALLKFLYDHIAYGADFHARDIALGSRRLEEWPEKTLG